MRPSAGPPPTPLRAATSAYAVSSHIIGEDNCAVVTTIAYVAVHRHACAKKTGGSNGGPHCSARHDHEDDALQHFDTTRRFPSQELPCSDTILYELIELLHP